MRCEGLTIDWRYEYAEAMGRPYAFVGGVVDFEPEKVKRIRVNSSAEIVVDLDDGSRAWFQLDDLGPSPTVDTILHSMRVREEWLPEEIPAGTTDAVATWLDENGVRR